ncbi:hypothetical protein ACFQ5N_13795 [Lutibacter holmesii]|uniref:Endonuclease n=1 Tax=Lutibacter holmesii TaxID=1137985 RepID=A0ABW3WR92_9FLAO
MNYELLEKELQKRTKLAYTWKTKQTDILDKETNFIYKTASFNKVLEKIDTLFKKQPTYSNLKNYALNRWFNFWSAKAVEHIFCEHSSVQAHKNSKDKYVDFFISNIPFDHKTTVFPKGFQKSIPYAITHKHELISWLYNNQSQQQRKHYKNRLFIVLINFEEQNSHWKLKAEILWLKSLISTYLINFDSSKLQCFTFNNEKVYADVIWAIK